MKPGKLALSMAAMAAIGSNLSHATSVKIRRVIDPLPPDLLYKLEENHYRANEEAIEKAKAKRERKAAAKAARKATG